MKILFLSTTSFPFGYSEPLLADLIKFTSDFDQVILLQPKPTSSPLLYDLPNNVSIVYLKDSLTIFEKLKGLKCIFNRLVLDEIRVSKQRGIKISLQFLKVLLNYFSLASKNKKHIQSLIDEYATEFTSFYFYSYWCTEATLAASLIKSKRPNLSVVSRMHAFDLYEERHSPNYLPFRGLLIKILNNIVFVSEQGMNYFISKYNFLDGFEEKRCIVGRLGVFKENEEIYSPIVFNKKEFVIVSCSSLIPLKRVHLIIEALSEIKNQSIYWVHFGSGTLEKELLTLSKMLLGNSSVRFDFKGFVLNQEIKNYFANNPVDLFVNTSKYEGLPISMMEAMAFGIPCVGTNVGGVSEIIEDHKNGYLLPVDFLPIDLTNTFNKFFALNEEERKRFQLLAINTWKTKFHGLNNLKTLKTSLLKPKKQCVRCLFDDEMYVNILFDNQGLCNVCLANEKLKKKTIFSEDLKTEKLNELLTEIRKRKHKKYDCLIGLSGGVDSSYVVYKAKEWGLNPLILHIDNGWNSELASMNIENIVKKMGFDLYTYVINWSEMKDIQLSFLKSSVVDIDLPMDNAIMAVQFKVANKFGIQHILSGINTVTEGWMPTDFSHYKLDSLNIKSIQRKFGSVKLKTFPTVSPLGFKWNTQIRKVKFCAPLDFIDFNKAVAKEILIREFGWRDYGGKHYENVFTKFYQGVILPDKFNFDKRISHLSVLISSGQINKSEGEELMKIPPYKIEEYMDDKLFFCKKIGLTEVEFDEIMKRNPVSHLTFTSYVNIINKLIKVKKILTFYK
jgi:N-acetyl sugar amidotransferase